MRIVPVTSPELAKAWLRMPLPLYRNDPAYVQPLDKDIEQVFDPAQNERFQRGKAMRWLLEDGTGRYIGRIAAFYEQADLIRKPVGAGGIGFFECVDDKAAARELFAVAEAWLQAEGANGVDAPINFGDRDRWWGLLVEGFIPPSYQMPYNLPYYQALFEDNGYQTYFRQLTYYRPVAKPLHPIVKAKWERIAKDPDYSFRHLERGEIVDFAEPFRQIYNKAWTQHSGVPLMEEEHARALVKEMAPIMDPKLIWFGFYQGKPISFFVMLPDLNEYFRHLHGRFGLWEQLKLLWMLKTRKTRRMIGLVYGVLPEFQGKGVETAMVHASSRVVQDPKAVPYVDFEMNWIGDFNPRMMKLAELFGGEVNKVHITYRKIFDPAIPFERCPEIR